MHELASRESVSLDPGKQSRKKNKCPLRGSQKGTDYEILLDQRLERSRGEVKKTQKEVEGKLLVADIVGSEF